MDAISFHSIWTVITLSAFVALIIWAWGKKQKTPFDQASRIPLEDDESPSQHSKDEESQA